MSDQKLHIRVILAEPVQEGNVGSVCRAMKNFGFGDLVMINPCERGDFSRAMASHAQDVLADAVIVDTLDQALEGVNLLVGTTGKLGESTREHLRVPCFSPSELKTMLEDKQGAVALLFGREDRGLSREELERCDVVISIPTSGVYPVMNLSHAVTVVLYELSGIRGDEYLLADAGMLELLYQHFERLLEHVNHPEHKRDKTLLMIRRIIGRAMLTPHEYFTLIGVLRDVELALVRNRDECDNSWVENN
ncbi:MAG TPA: RNA methyltransferase [Methanocella sp.]|nr:RNA methyltransferase [Methanocella sp.]